MRKFFTILALALLLVTSSVDLGQSKSRPYDPGELTNGGSTDDHPWGGDNSGGSGGTTGGSGTITVRPIYTTTTGFWAIDVMTHYFVRFHSVKAWKLRNVETGETTGTTTSTTTSTPTQSN